MQSQDLQTLEAASSDFYTAFESLDISRMRSVWSATGSVKCIHPGWQPIYGYDDIIKSWHQIFNSADYMEIELLQAQFHATATLGVIWGIESVLVAAGGKTSRSQIQVTNVFTKESHQWRMVLHHACP